MRESTDVLYSHNLVNALYAMKGLLETCLVEQEEGRVSPRSHGILKRAHEQAAQALRIAKRLGSVWMSGQADKKEDPQAKVAVRRAWQGTLALLKSNFRFEEIEIVERIPHPFPPIQCRPRDFCEILYHLGRNAFQAMHGQGKLVIRAELSFSTAEEAAARIQLVDTGPGIPETEFTHLFLPFYSTKSPREGNGLGLYLTQQLVRRNGGRITVSSFKGSGTTFTLEFPLARSK